MKKLLLLTLVIGSTLAVRLQTADAKQTNFKQLILPLDCVFETVNDGLGTVHYLTPTECGQVIPQPAPTVNPTGGGTTAVQPQATALPRQRRLFSILAPSTPTTATSKPSGPGHGDESVNNNGAALLINNDSDSFTAKGYVVIVKAGNILLYRPGDQPAGQIRSLTVNSVHSDSVDFNVQPLNLSFTARLNKSTAFDNLNNGKPAVSINILKTDRFKTATLRIRLLSDVTAGTTRPVSTRLQFILLLFIIVLLVTVRYWSNRFGSAKRS